jgi:hypothetical protein
VTNAASPPRVRVTFTQNLQRHVACPPVEVQASTVREALELAFEAHPAVRSYVLDEHGGLRHHMVIFVNGDQIHDRAGLGDAVPPGGELYVMQALSGG